jgi:syntaxin 1B/2/3
MQDRLDELRGGEQTSGQICEIKDENNKDTSKIKQLLQYDAKIKEHLKELDILNKELQKLYAKQNKSKNTDDENKIIDEFQLLVEKYKNITTKISERIEQMKEFDCGESETLKISRNNMVQFRSNNLYSFIQDSNTSIELLNKKRREQQYRRLQIVNEKITEKEAQELVDSGKAQEYIQRTLTNDKIQKTVMDIDKRYVDILKLQQSVLEIHQLFKDLETLVDLQSESMDIIESNVLKAKNHVENGEVNLQGAEKYGKKASKRICCCLVILLFVLIVVLAPVLTITLKNS